MTHVPVKRAFLGYVRIFQLENLKSVLCLYMFIYIASVIFVVVTECEEERGERIQFSEGLTCSMTGCVSLSDELCFGSLKV